MSAIVEISSDALKDDLLVGALEVAEFMGMSRRQIYSAVEGSHLPFIRIGLTVCARRSTLTRWIENEENTWLQQMRQDAEDSEPQAANPSSRQNLRSLSATFAAADRRGHRRAG